MGEIKNKSILLISPESWGNVFVSKHHYANYLSKENNVYFLSPPEDWALSAIFSFKIKITRINKNLNVLTYKNPLPRINKLPAFIQRITYNYLAKKIQEKINVSELDIIWSFDPFRFWDFSGWKTKNKIYHTVDVHFNSKHEVKIAATANHIFATTEVLIEPLKQYNRNIYKIRHGADIDGFEVGANYKIQLPGNNTLKAGLVGNFNDNVDYDLLLACITKNPQIDFIMVGPYKSNNLSPTQQCNPQIETFQKFNNVFFLGEVKSVAIISYLTLFNINLVLYREDKRDIIISPHKMMAYFYSGNVTVASLIPEYTGASQGLIEMCDSNNEIPEKINAISQNINTYNSPELKLLRKGFAIENSYLAQIKKIGEIIYN